MDYFKIYNMNKSSQKFFDRYKQKFEEDTTTINR